MHFLGQYLSWQACFSWPPSSICIAQGLFCSLEENTSSCTCAVVNCTYEDLHVQPSSNKICCNWMICQRKSVSPYMYDFYFCNRDSHHDLPNSDIPPLHFLDLIQENNMCTSQQKHGYSYKSDQSNGPSLKHIAKNIQNTYNHILKVPASILLGLKLPPVATFAHHYSQKILQCCS